jgi:hypothetical protein
VGLFGRGIRGGSREAGRVWLTCCEGVQKQLVIGVIFENGFAVIAPRRQVLERPVVFNPQWPSHESRYVPIQTRQRPDPRNAWDFNRNILDLLSENQRSEGLRELGIALDSGITGLLKQSPPHSAV